MPKGWKIIVTTERLGGGQPLKGYYLVMVEGQRAAVKALREATVVQDAHITIIGAATGEEFAWLDLKEGDIRKIAAVS